MAARRLHPVTLCIICLVCGAIAAAMSLHWELVDHAREIATGAVFGLCCGVLVSVTASGMPASRKGAIGALVAAATALVIGLLVTLSVGKLLLAVLCGGGLGALARYWVGNVDLP